MRFVGAWAEHGREPAATRLADRIDCGTDITCLSVRPDGERRAVREFETQNIGCNSERVRAQLPAFGMIAVAAFITSDMNGLEICPKARATKTGAATSPQPMGRRRVKSARSECLDHLFIFSEAGLRRDLSTYVSYFNHWRPHRSIGQRKPRHPEETRSPSQRKYGKIVADPVLGGLHHVYKLAA
jgi:hypothetical protein